MNYTDFFGYYPAAPAMGMAANGQAPPNAATVPADVALAPVFAGNSIGFSSDIAIAGWLAAIVIAFAAYRLIWEASA